MGVSGIHGRMGRGKRIGELCRDKRGMSTPLTVSLVLALLLVLCVASEFFRLQVIAYGIRNSLQEAVISVATANYNELYSGLREGYSGGYYMDGGQWEENLDYGDVYSQLDNLLGTELEGEYHIKWQAQGYEYRLFGLAVRIQNVPFAPGNADRNFEAEISVQAEIPLSFGWDFLPPVSMTIKTKAVYMPKF